MPNAPESLEGTLIVPNGTRFAIVAARFNSFIVERLVEGALDALRRHGADPAKITVVRVPGAWEIPFACARLANSDKVDAVIALGAVIRGATPHFDHVSNEVSKGVAQVALSSGTPVAFGVLTTDDLDQALARAGGAAGNKGHEAAEAALTAADVLAQIRASRA